MELCLVKKSTGATLPLPNLYESHLKALHSRKVAVSCEMSGFGIIGPCFFEDGTGSAVTVTSRGRYVTLTLPLFAFNKMN
jgi:hypothetical protein